MNTIYIQVPPNTQFGNNLFQIFAAYYFAKENNYDIYNGEDELYIWSYKGFNYIKDGKIKRINIFKDDIYEIPLATKINKYIVVPNYEQEHNFKDSNITPMMEISNISAMLTSVTLSPNVL